eukprot:Pgem_evm1s5279
MSVLNWIKKQKEISSPSDLVLMGCSAGALGAQIWSAKIQELLNTTKNNTVLFVDSYVGIFPKNQNLKNTQGTFVLKGYSEPNQTQVSCYNISHNLAEEDKLAAPIGKVVNHDWSLCSILKDKMVGLVSEEIITKCQNNAFNLGEFFNTQFNHFDAPVYFINSKADQVQRQFATMVGLTVANDTGLNTSTLADVELVSENINCTANLENGTYTHCEQLQTCVVNGAQNNYNFYKNITFTNYDDTLSLYTIKLLQKINASSKLGNILSVIINKVAAQYKNYQMSGGLHGQEYYWKRAADMLNSYTTTKKSWFLVNSIQHCYTCYNVMYKQEVNGELMVDWIQEGVNNLLQRKGKLAPKTCDNVNTDYPTCI